LIIKQLHILLYILERYLFKPKIPCQKNHKLLRLLYIINLDGFNPSPFSS
jgi:hypothetical protein